MTMDNSQEAVRERVRLVADHWMNGKNRTEAYRLAGYAAATPANAAEFFRAHKDEIDYYVYNAMKDKVPVAVNVLAEIMVNGKSETARVKAAIELLDRAGYSATSKIEITQKDVSELENKKLEEEINSLLEKAGKLRIVGGTDVKS